MVLKLRLTGDMLRGKFAKITFEDSHLSEFTFTCSITDVTEIGLMVKLNDDVPCFIRFEKMSYLEILTEDEKNAYKKKRESKEG